MDDNKVVKLLTGNPRVGSAEELAEELHALADELAEGKWGDTTTVILLLETSDGTLSRHTLTRDDHLDRARMAGLFAYAQHMVICPRD